MRLERRHARSLTVGKDPTFVVALYRPAGGTAGTDVVVFSVT